MSPILVIDGPTTTRKPHFVDISPLMCLSIQSGYHEMLSAIYRPIV